MLKEDLAWDTGRAVIALNDGRQLSILNEERQDYLDEQKYTSVSWLRGEPWIDIQADEGTWEVAIMVDDIVEHEILADWVHYHVDDGTGSGIVYGYVPEDVVIDYANKFGGKAVVA